jgi:hypothetical protein
VRAFKLLGLLSLTLLAILCVVPGARSDEPPKELELFAAEKWYKDEAAKEQDFTGVLRYTERKPSPGGRELPFSLEMKNETRLVYVVKAEDVMRLKPFVGQRVQITGKPVEITLRETQKEIWPARLKLLPDRK